MNSQATRLGLMLCLSVGVFSCRPTVKTRCTKQSRTASRRRAIAQGGGGQGHRDVRCEQGRQAQRRGVGQVPGPEGRFDKVDTTGNGRSRPT